MAIIGTAAATLGSLFSSGGAAAAAGGAAAGGSSGIMGSVMGWLGGSTAGFSNSGLLSMGGSLLSSLTGFLQGGDQAEELKRAQKEQWKQQMINTREQYRQLGDMERQANKEYHTDIIQNQASLLQQQAQVELMAGASGTGGASISSMLNDLSAQGGRNQAQLIDNFENQQRGFINQAKAIQMGGQMQMREFKKPSAFSTMLSGLGSAATSYMTGSKTGKGLAQAWSESRTYSSGIGR